MRKAYERRRVREQCALGTEEAPVSWYALDIFAKVHLLWDLCEWQMEQADRFRDRMHTSDTEQLQWVKYHVYCLLDDD